MLSVVMLSVIMFCVVMLSVVVLSVVMLRRYVASLCCVVMLCRYTECRVLFIIMQNIFLLIAILLNVVMLSVVAPTRLYQNKKRALLVNNRSTMVEQSPYQPKVNSSRPADGTPPRESK